MPSKSLTSLLTLPGWVKGLNRDADPYQLTLQESPDALNVDFGLRGSVKKRRGYTAWDEAGAASAPRKMLAWNILDGTSRLFYVQQDGTIFFGSAAPLTSSAGGIDAYTTDIEYHVGSASLNDVLYFTALNATNPRSYDGTSWASETATIFDGTANRFPKAAFLATHHDRIFAANVKSGSTRYASRLYWSDALAAETWTAANYIDFDPDDGQQITGLAPIGEALAIFKENSIQLLTGKSEESFARFRIESQIGTTAPGTIVPYSGSLYFFDPSAGVFLFDGAGFSPLDEGMNHYILDNLSMDYVHKSFAYIWDGSYYLGVPFGTSTYPNRTFVYNLTTQAWAEYDYAVPAAAVWADELYGGGPRNTAGVYQLHSGTSDDGTAIAAHFRTAWLVPEDAPYSKFRTRRCDAVWTAEEGITVTFDMYRDFKINSYVYRQNISLDPGGTLYGTAVYGVDTYGSGRDEVLSRTTGWGNVRWRALQYKVSSSGAAAAWELNKMALVVSSLDRVRGEN